MGIKIPARSDTILARRRRPTTSPSIFCFEPAPSQPTLEIIEKNLSGGMFDVPSGRQQDDSGGRRQIQDVSNDLTYRWMLEFVVITTCELEETSRLMPVPVTQSGAGSDVLEPLVESGVPSRYAPRPEPVYQHSISAGRGLINPTESYALMGSRMLGCHLVARSWRGG